MQLFRIGGLLNIFSIFCPYCVVGALKNKSQHYLLRNTKLILGEIRIAKHSLAIVDKKTSFPKRVISFIDFFK